MRACVQASKRGGGALSGVAQVAVKFVQFSHGDALALNVIDNMMGLLCIGGWPLCLADQLCRQAAHHQDLSHDGEPGRAGFVVALWSPL